MPPVVGMICFFPGIAFKQPESKHAKSGCVCQYRVSFKNKHFPLMNPLVYNEDPIEFELTVQARNLLN